MVTLNVKSASGEIDTVRGLLTEGLGEEKRRIHFALEVSASKIKKYEEKYGISTKTFLEKFKNKEIEEDEDTFTWWAEERLFTELNQKLLIIKNITICQS
ncbi:MAG TPA: hypothetical protein VJ440_14120 [Candidatus Brocadiaceae bacterium]|nr:hypothetical protein [Candidatus Brocadiaceae bacterium]